MLKFISVSLFCLLCLNSLAVSAKDAKKTPGEAKDKTQYTYDIDENYTFDDNSLNVSDEQLEKMESANKIEDETTFGQKIINSSHFSSGTATRTYIPLNKSIE